MRLRFHGLIAAAVLMIVAGRALATPSLVMDVATGNVLYENEATHPWYPASVTKLMTVYVALSAVRDHQISLDTPLVVSRYAASMPPSKMGFRPGTEVTLGNALKMLMVKSPNDIAITIAEGIAGSVPAFAEDMNASAARLGMKQSHFVNPNGLQNPEHYSSARDLAVLARAIYLTFPQYADLFDIGAIRVDGKIIPNHNDMLGRYPGADGMKTGFTCDAGFNLVASATRGNHHYLAVVLGAPTPRERLVRTAVLFDRAFAGIDQPQPMDADEPVGGAPEDMRDVVCHRRGRAMTAFQAETDRLEAPLLTIGQRSSPLGVFSTSALALETPAALRIAMMPVPVFDPVTLTTGPAPGYNGPIAGPRPPHTAGRHAASRRQRAHRGAGRERTRRRFAGSWCRPSCRDESRCERRRRRGSASSAQQASENRQGQIAQESRERRRKSMASTKLQKAKPRNRSTLRMRQKPSPASLPRQK